MDNISQILEDRIINGVKHFDFYKGKYKINKEDFNSKLKNLKELKSHYSNEILIKACKLFDSKIIADKKIIEWNKKNPQEITKTYSFSASSRLDENGKSIESKENFNRFYLDLKEQYQSQTKLLLQKDLPWIVENSHIKQTDCVCFYCGINEQILSELCNDQKYTCKTKRNNSCRFEEIYIFPFSRIEQPTIIIIKFLIILYPDNKILIIKSISYRFNPFFIIFDLLNSK